MQVKVEPILQQLPGGIFAAGSMAVSAGGQLAAANSPGQQQQGEEAGVMGAGVVRGGSTGGGAPMHVDCGAGQAEAGQQAQPAGGWAPTQL